MIAESTSYFCSLSLPFNPASSITKQILTTSPPSSSPSFAIASTVPPVAIRSSMITTFWRKIQITVPMPSVVIKERIPNFATITPFTQPTIRPATTAARKQTGIGTP